MRRRPVIFVLAFAALAGAVGCAKVGRVINALGDVVGKGADHLTFVKVEDEPLLFEAPGPMEIAVDSFGGDVHVLVDPALTYAQVTVTRRGVHGFGRRDEAIASLAEIDYRIEIVPGTLGPVLEISTRTTHVEPHYQRCDVRVDLPEVEGLRIRTHNGDVVARDVEGAIDVMTDDGHVRVMTPRPLRDRVTIINHAGGIDYRIRAESSGKLDCRALRGRVSHHADFGELIVHSGTRHDTLLATLNRGTNPVVLRAADGDIRVAVVAAPTQVGRFIME